MNRGKTQFAVEFLERRTLLSWASLTNTLPNIITPDNVQTSYPDVAGTMLMLSDGSVMIQGNRIGQFSSVPSPFVRWYGLTPSATGSYSQGTFYHRPSMLLGRLYFATDVLRNGKVVILGAEGTDPNATFTPIGETYDPTQPFDPSDPTAGWSPITDSAGDSNSAIISSLDESPSEVLSDGTILIDNKGVTPTQIYNPSSTGQWFGGSSLQKIRPSGEQTWVKLADGSILAMEVDSLGNSVAERFFQGSDYTQDHWDDEGAVVDGSGNAIQLWTVHPAAPTVVETGAGVLLPDGRVFFTGSTGETALYSPTNTWARGPDISDPAISGSLYGALDAPAAVERNGKVLFAAGSVAAYGNSTRLFEYDPGSNTIAPVDMTNGPDLSNTIPYTLRMLDLPNGQILLSVGTEQLWTFTPFGGSIRSTRPTISSVVGNGTYMLTGTQLNGQSEGATFGDDGQMATNFPIVSLTDASGNVHYATSLLWSSTGVQTGSQTVTTDFTTDVGPGPYLLTVSASGIVSDSALFIEMGGTTDHYTLRVDPTISTLVDVVNGAGTVSTVAKSSFTKIIVAADSSAAVLTVDLINGNPVPAQATDIFGQPIPNTGGLNLTGAGGTLKVESYNNEVSAIAAAGFHIGSSPVAYSNVASLVFDVIGGTFAPGGNVGLGAPVTINDSSTVTFPAGFNQDLAAMNIFSGAVARMPNNSSPDLYKLTLSGLTIAATGTLDLWNNAMLLKYVTGSDPIATIQSYLASGYHATAWDGDRIVTGAGAANTSRTTGIGYADSATAPTVNTTPNSIELRYTLYGDANLDHSNPGSSETVDIFDLNAMLPHFNTNGNAWTSGDFNYSSNGATDIFDLNALLPNFNHALVSSASPALSISGQTTFAVGGSPLWIAMADVNGDGIADVIVDLPNSNSVAVLLGNGNGTFGAATTFAAGGTGTGAIRMADVNADGKLDIVASNLGSNNIAVLLGNGNGTFQAAGTFAAAAPWAMVVADVNGDGKPDIVASDFYGSAVDVLLGNGNGTFGAQQTYAAGPFSYSVAVGDLNGDGKTDVVVAAGFGHNVSVLLGNGNGSFGAASTFATESVGYANTVAVADVNGDGKSDLVVSNLSNFGSISVLLGNGDGTFRSQLAFDAGTYTRDVHAVDINGDGKMDLVAVNTNDNDVCILLGNGDGTFQAEQTLAVGAHPWYAAIADVNGDGKLDIVVADYGGNRISVLLNMF